MGWSYDSGNLAAPLNKVRLLIGDTDSDDPQLQDEEIQTFIDDTTTSQAAAQLALNALAARSAGLVDKWVGDLKILESQKRRGYEAQAETIVATSRALGTPSAGGIRVSEKEAQEADTDLVEPSFKRGLFDFEQEPG